MKRRMLRGMWCIALAFCAGIASADEYAERLQALKQIASENFKADLTTRAASASMAAAYQRLFADIALDPLQKQPEALRALFDAASMTAFYTDDLYHVGKMQQSLDLLHADGFIDLGRAADVYDAYLAAEAFDAAAQFAASHSYLHVRPLPVINAQQDGQGLQEWRIEADGRRLVAAPFVFPDGPYMVVTSSIRCHFSLDSMRAMQSFADFKYLKSRSKWLMRIDKTSDFSEIATWNKTYPDFQFSIPRRYRRWADISLWDTPTFYFFNNGTLVYQFSGWPAKGNLENVKHGMAEAGFLPLTH
nr:hypothetical protein [uncultured Duganella sp.]